MPCLYNYAIKNKIKENFMQLYGLKTCDSLSQSKKSAAKSAGRIYRCAGGAGAGCSA
jgi:hypothetical protein